MVAGEGAVIEHCKFQDESLSAYHISALHAHLGRSSNFISHSFAAGARLSRNNIRTSLAGEGLQVGRSHETPRFYRTDCGCSGDMAARREGTAANRRLARDQ